MVFRQNRDGSAMPSPSFPQGFPKVSPRPAPSVFGVPKKQKLRQAGQSPSRATFEKKNDKNRKGGPCGWIRCSRIGGRRPKPRGGSRAARQAVGAARLAMSQFRRNASAERPAPSGPCASIEPGGAPRGPIPEPLRSGGRRGPGAAEARGRLERRSKRHGAPKPCGDPALRFWGVGSRRRYRASLSSKGAKAPSLRMQVWPWDSNRGRSRLLTASISW